MFSSGRLRDDSFRITVAISSITVCLTGYYSSSTAVRSDLLANLLLFATYSDTSYLYTIRIGNNQYTSTRQNTYVILALLRMLHGEHHSVRFNADSVLSGLHTAPAQCSVSHSVHFTMGGTSESDCFADYPLGSLRVARRARWLRVKVIDLPLTPRAFERVEEIILGIGTIRRPRRATARAKTEPILKPVGYVWRRAGCGISLRPHKRRVHTCALAHVLLPLFDSSNYLHHHHHYLHHHHHNLLHQHRSHHYRKPAL